MHGLVSRRVKLSKSGRNWKGCCPFHNEKSPSFYVYEDGFHCFGCGAHGDAISFVMQTGGGTFIEAVESLAGEAGLEVPRPSARAVEAEQERLDLFGVLEAAQGEFTRLLQAREGAAGLAYLRQRGLSDETVRRFGLGWSGEGRGALITALARAGVEPGLDAGSRAVARTRGWRPGAGGVLGPGHLPDPRPARADREFRRAHARGCQTQVHQRRRDAALFQEAQPLRARSRAGGGAAGQAGGGGRLPRRDRAAPGRVRRGGGAAGHRR